MSDIVKNEASKANVSKIAGGGAIDGDEVVYKHLRYNFKKNEGYFENVPIYFVNIIEKKYKFGSKTERVNFFDLGVILPLDSPEVEFLSDRFNDLVAKNGLTSEVYTQDKAEKYAMDEKQKGRAGKLADLQTEFAKKTAKSFIESFSPKTAGSFVGQCWISARTAPTPAIPILFKRDGKTHMAVAASTKDSPMYDENLHCVCKDEDFGQRSRVSFPFHLRYRSTLDKSDRGLNYVEMIFPAIKFESIMTKEKLDELLATPIVFSRGVMEAVEAKAKDLAIAYDEAKDPDAPKKLENKAPDGPKDPDDATDETKAPDGPKDPDDDETGTETVEVSKKNPYAEEEEDTEEAECEVISEDTQEAAWLRKKQNDV